jgi:hypothetical protein
MISSPDISNNAFSKHYQNKIFLYFVLVFAVLLSILKLPMAELYYDTVSNLLTFAPMLVIIVMAGFSFWKAKQYPDYQPIIRKFYLTFTLKFLIAIFVFYVFYSPTLFSSPLIALYRYLRTLLTFEGLYFLSSYLLTIVIAVSIIFLALRAYQKTKGTYQGSIQALTKKTLYGVFALAFLILVSSASAYPSAYKPLTDTLGDTLYTLSSGTVKIFKGSNTASYSKVESLSNFTTQLASSFKKTTKNITESNNEFKTTLEAAKENLTESITKSSEDLTNKIKEDLTGKIGTEGGTMEGSLIIKGDDADLTVEGLTTTRDIIPDDSLQYNLGKSGKSWNELYIHRLLGASPVFIGNGSSSQGLTADGDLVVSNNLEVQGRIYTGAYVFPASDGSAEQVLVTDGNGNLTWGEGGVTPAGSTGQIQFNSNGALGATANLAWNSGTSRLEVGGTVEATAFMLPGGLYLNSDSVSTNYWGETSGDIYRETGSIGMGNNSPDERLDITGRIKLNQGVAPSTTTDRLYNVAGDLYWNGLKMGENFWAESSDNVSYTLSGNVGIGTTNPLSKLSVAGTVRATNFFDTESGVYLVPSSINGNYWGESAGNIYRETGNVGIGTVNPMYQLDITGDMGFVGGKRIYFGTANRYIWNYGIVNDVAANMLFLNRGAAGDITFGTNDIERMRITSSGNVGIGTTSPNSKLSIVASDYNAISLSDNSLNNNAKGAVITGARYNNSNLNFSGLATWDDNVYRQVVVGGGAWGRPDANVVSFYTAGSYDETNDAGVARMVIGRTGTISVGVGNLTIPSQMFYIKGATSASTEGTLSLVNSSNTSLLYVRNDGRVGIGTTNPGYPLDIATSGASLIRATRTAALQGILRIDSGSGIMIGNDTTHATNGKLQFVSNGSFATPQMTLDSSGNFGIGTTSPTSTLQVSGLITTAGITSTASISLNGGGSILTHSQGANINFTQGSGSYLPEFHFKTGASSEPMTILNSGNIGIGTTNPAYPLHVAGGYAYFPGNVVLGNGGTIANGNSTTLTWGATASATGTFIFAGGTNVSTSAVTPFVKISPVYNQVASGASNTDLLINRTETSVGTGPQYLIDAQVGGVRKFSITNAGVVQSVSSIYSSNTLGAPVYAGSGGGNNTAVNFFSAGGWTFSTATEQMNLARGTMTQTSGINAAVKIIPTYNQVTSSASNTDLLINRTETSVGTGPQYLIDAQVGGVSKFSVNNLGYINGGGITSSAASFAISQSVVNIGATLRSASSTDNNGLSFQNNTGASDTRDGSFFSFAPYAVRTNTSGVQSVVKIFPTYNQVASGASNTDLLINRTETSVGTGPQYLIDAQVGGVSKFKVDNSGVVTTTGAMSIAGNLVVSSRIRATSPGVILMQDSSYATANTFQVNVSPTLTQASGTNGAFKINPTYVQGTSSASNADLLINRTETSVGTGPQYLIDAQVGGLSKFVIKNNGNVGIGTTNPSQALEVVGAIRGSSSLVLNGGNVSISQRGLFGDFYSGVSNGFSVSYWNGSAVATGMVLLSTTGNVGIGTTNPGTLLDVKGTTQPFKATKTNGGTVAQFADDGYSNTLSISSNDTLGPLLGANTGHGIQFAINNSSVPSMFINSSGNVGIGTTNPGAKLAIDATGIGNSNDISKGLMFYDSVDGDTTGIYPDNWNTFLRINAKSRLYLSASEQIMSNAPIKFGGSRNAELSIGITAGTPPFTFVGDEDTGMFSPDVNSIAFSVGATEKVRIDNQGNVGIGTTNPAVALDVVGQIKGSSSGIFQGVQVGLFNGFYGNYTGTYDYGITHWTGAAYRTDLVILANNGNVGIGTTNPLSLLHVSKDQNGQTGIQFDNGNAGTDASALFDIRNGALGTADRLVFGVAGTGYTAITGWQDATFIATQSGLSGGLILNANAGGIKFETGGNGSSNQKMVINNSGNVGIGTTAPYTKFDVVGGSTGAETALATLRSNFSTADTATTLRLINSASSASLAGVELTALRTDTGGAGTTDFILRTYDSGPAVPVEKLRIKGTSGNVGIGTTAPAEKLEVSGGNIRVTGGAFIDDGTTLTVPDYVFEENYNLMPLDELATYISTNKHLPNVPDMFDRKGWAALSMQDRDMRLLEKTEENTLYILGLNLKTDNNISTLTELQISIDQQLGVVSKGINEITEGQETINKQISRLTDRQATINDQITKQDNLIAILQTQILELQNKLNTETNLAQIDLNTQDATLIKLLLGVDRVKNPEDVDILGKLSSKTLSTGGIEIMVIDPDTKTIGTGTIKAGDKSVKIDTKAAKTGAQVFITPKKGLEQSIGVAKITDGQSFEAELFKPEGEDVDFSWWIIQSN